MLVSMSYIRFLQQLLETGNVSIETPDRPSDTEVQSAGEILRQFESGWRLEWAGTAPEFHQPVASWAAESLYRSCQLLLSRDLDPEEVQRSLATPCPKADAGKAQQHYLSLIHI